MQAATEVSDVFEGPTRTRGNALRTSRGGGGAGGARPGGGGVRAIPELRGSSERAGQVWGDRYDYLSIKRRLVEEWSA
jgi:hypothetical protein